MLNIDCINVSKFICSRCDSPIEWKAKMSWFCVHCKHRNLTYSPQSTTFYTYYSQNYGNRTEKPAANQMNPLQNWTCCWFAWKFSFSSRKIFKLMKLNEWMTCNHQLFHIKSLFHLNIFIKTKNRRQNHFETLCNASLNYISCL